MTIYRNNEFETSEALREAINSDLEGLTYPYAVVHKLYGAGQLVDIKVPLTGGILYATIDFPTVSKVFSLDAVLTNKLLTMPDTLTDLVTEAQSVYKLDFETRQAEKVAAEREARIQAELAKKKAEEEKKAEAKYQKTKAKAIQDFDELASAPRQISTTEEFYYSLGWLTKHMGCLTAILPDYLGSSFEKHFGSDAPKTLVDGRAKTSGGYAKQWSWEFKCNIKKLKDTLVPAYLQTVTTDISKGIHNTSFLWDLVENYGFQFGKKQDTQKIRDHIPSTYLSVFEAGLK